MGAETMANVLASLDVMWQGMVGLFVVCGFVMGMVYLVNALVGRRAAGGS
jgi:hypothetical protein